MKLEVLREIIKKKENKNEFAIVTNLATGNSEIFESGKSLSKDFEKFTDQINAFYQSKKNGIIEGTDIFVESYIRPIKVIIVCAVHVAQYLVDFANSLNFEISVIDPRGYFATEQRFPNMKIINKWPDEAFKEIETDSNTALIALTHDPKIDDPALQHAIKKKFYYIGALGSKKTHTNRCERLKKAGFSDQEINQIHGPIGIKLGGRAAPGDLIFMTAVLGTNSGYSLGSNGPCRGTTYTNAPFTGAKTVKGPTFTNASSTPAALTATTNVEKSSKDAATCSAFGSAPSTASTADCPFP